MKKHQVYGIGNALVDIEIEVNEEFLANAGVEKGLMTLVEEKRQDELLKKVDGHQHKRSCGGSAANTIIAVAQYGGRSFYSCKVANDEQGEFYFSNLLEHGVQTNLHGTRENGTTGKCMVFVTPDADRTMNTYLGITTNFSEKEIIDEELIDSEWLYIEGYLVTGPSGKAAAIKARELAEKNGVKTALTFSDPGVVAHFKGGFEQMLGSGVDLLFCNEAEALSYTGTQSVDEAFEKLKSIAKSFAITRGPQGATLWDGKIRTEILTHKVQAVDTNGAGDLFAGTFLYALTSGHSFADAGRLSCMAASQLVTQFGPRLESEQPKEIYKQLFS
jgi:sugar/nucleoside kinase (ribokinase family)